MYNHDYMKTLIQDDINDVTIVSGLVMFTGPTLCKSMRSELVVKFEMTQQEFYLRLMLKLIIPFVFETYEANEKNITSIYK